MRYEQPIGQSVFRVRVLPARAGYLTKRNDAGGVLEAIRVASTRWAGVSELIIPVPESGSLSDWWRDVVGFADLDGLVNVNVERDVAERVGQTLDLAVVGVADVGRSGRTQFSTHPAHLEQTRWEFASQAPVLASSTGALWEKVAAGDLSDEQAAACASGQAPARRPLSGPEIGLAQIDETCWLDAGAAQFSEHRITNPRFAPAIVWVTQPNSLEDCVDFWNLRALRSRSLAPSPILLVPADQVFHWTGFPEAFTDRLARPEFFDPDVLLWSASVEPDQLDEIAEGLRLIRTTNLTSTIEHPPPPPRQGPFTYRQDVDPYQYFYFQRRYGETSQTLEQVYRDRTVVDVDSPVQFTGAGRVLVRVASSAFEGLPKRSTTAALVKDGASWSEDEIELATNASNRYRLELRVPSLSAATWALLGDHTTHAALSSKGQLAHRLRDLGAAEVLLQDPVIQVIESLRTGRSQDLERALQRTLEHVSPSDELRDRLEELVAEWGPQCKRRFLSISNIKGLGDYAGTAVEGLCFRSWAERGLKITCDQCKIRSFVPLPEATPEPRCPACGATNTRFEPAGGNPDKGPEMHYRLNALVDRAADQGIVPHLFADAVLTAEDPQTFLLQGVDVTFEGGTTREVDLYGITGGRVVAGEAKTNPEAFTPEQLESDIELSAALGADIHLIVSTGEIPDAIEEEARQLANTRDLKVRPIDSRTPDTLRLGRSADLGGLNWVSSSR